MNLGRGFSIPQENGVIQNGDIWVPATPEKPILQRPSNAHSEMPNNPRWGENWGDLVGIYTGVLQNDSGNLLTNCQGADSYNRMQHCSSSMGAVGLKTANDAYSRLPQNFNPNGLVGVNSLEHNTQLVEVSRLQRFRTLDQKIGTSVQNLGEVMPQKVNSLAELLSMARSTKAPLSNVMPDRSTYVTSSTTEPLSLNRSTYVTSKAAVVFPHSLAESSQRTCTMVGARLQQNHVFLTDCDVVGDYNLQETPSGGCSVPLWQNYNLNLPPRFESGEPSGAARQFPVTPTQQSQSKNYEIIQVPFSVTDEISSKDMHNKDNAAVSQQIEILEREQNESLFNTQDKPIEAISTSPTENNSGGGNERIDLNKTPQQKTPKRRKHRPKVVVEGKPKKTPKPVTTKNNTSDGKPKRKYVRKNGNKTSTPPSTEVEKIVEESDAEPTRKSCKRVLNFDLENREEKESHDREFDCQGLNNGSSKLSLKLNLDSNNKEWPHLNRSSTSAVKEGLRNSFGKETQQIHAVNSFVHSNRVVPQNSMPQATMALAPPTPKGHTLNAIARILNAQKASINQVGGTDSHNHVHQRVSGSIAQLVIQANSSEPNFHCRRQLMLQTVPQPQNLVDANGEIVSKREHTHAQLRRIEKTTFMGSQLCSYGASKTGLCNNDSIRLRQNALEKGKMKIGDNFNGMSASHPSGIAAIEDSWGQIESVRNNNFPARSTAMHQNSSLINLNSKARSISYQQLMHEFQQKHAIPQVHPCAGRTVQKTSNNANESSTNSLCISANWKPDSAFPTNGRSVPTNEIITSPDPVAAKRRTVGRPRKVQPDDISQQPKSQNSRSYEHSSKKVRGLQKVQKTTFSIDDITNCMKELHINDNGNALVPYKGRDGAVVPYEGFDLVKKKQVRPRVDLDPETNRLWNLLMGKEGSENAEPMDANKQKWWEEERKVFRGRVDSFIARMHLVQGDRRFSKWKGSVVDSVIGVFLTQNVSDHLSSSAFMSLAAKFPLTSATIGSCYENGGSSSVVHKVHITFPDGTTCDQKIIKELSYDNGSTTTYPQSSEYRAENVTNEKEYFLINGHARRAEEDIVSSQSSSESFIFQASEDIRSSSGSNSEAEDGWNFVKNLGYLNAPEHSERISALQQHQFHIPGSFSTMRPLTNQQKLENPAYRQNLGPANSSNGYSYPITTKIPTHQSSVPQSSNNYWTNMLLGPEEIESLTNFEVNNGKGGIEPAHENVGVGAGIRFTAAQIRRQKFQLPPKNHAILNRSPELQTGLPDGSRSRNVQNSSTHGQGKQETFQKDSAFQMDPSRSAQASDEQTNDNSKDTCITLLTTEKEQVNSSRKPSHTVNSSTSTPRKRKAEKAKDEPFDWDTLRKQVQSEIGTRERSRETTDSMDYEALKNANVHEISDTIKERGMNNMLAERIKDFLNRLVRDHGLIDLEWLRDVPPDKAKDYLLSIRGLGLKSVECVRLLTLHHLAFPVDTNVGRIAVRLGWVPLQPLPESLQLHLLELYPVLESIQKYLWPRLCMLDQETLYELHYQMITFGKVFCTKREPNCNACPMRAECRHFASAFASARLALPAPGERQIVSSAAPNSATKSSDVIKPMLIPSSETTIERGSRLTRNSEPYVEEPSTPEPLTEVLEKDIEDAFYEDPDEIPVIKLNVEEFTTNLQNIIQEKMEIGEGDMSKALVALSPELASIPVPKLKHVSRLRTEHQVYELPDLHPLLKGMDRREPDDPSPYLLAIWTPGETADSVQPPENTCSSQEGGGLCGKSTCLSCSSAREAQGLTVRGTILIPCRTAMRGSFPLNGTYFQVNEVFADHDSSLNPIDVPRSLIWNLQRRTVFFGTSVSTIFKGLTTEGIQYCFWKGFVCVRGFDQKMRAPRPLKARLHLPASKMTKQNE